MSNIGGSLQLSITLFDSFMQLRLNPSQITNYLGWGVVLVVLGHLLSMTLRFVLGFAENHDLVTLLNLDHKLNLPTLFSFTVLLLSALLFLLVALEKMDRRDYFHRHWLGLSFIFLIVAIDQLVQFHERLHAPLRTLLDTSGMLFYAWTIPYTCLVAILGLAYLKFFTHLPIVTLLNMITAAGIFLVGAVGIETLEGSIAHNQEVNGILFAALVGLEGTCELLGAFWLVKTLLAYIENYGLRVYLEFSSGDHNTLIEQHFYDTERSPKGRLHHSRRHRRQEVPPRIILH